MRLPVPGNAEVKLEFALGLLDILGPSVGDSMFSAKRWRMEMLFCRWQAAGLPSNEPVGIYVPLQNRKMQGQE
jgi:hypothetical protein